MGCASLATEKGFFSREAAGSGSSPIEIRHGLEPTIVLENSRAASTGRVYFIRKQRMIGMFSGIKSGDYRIALQEPQFIEFWQRVKAETHTMRAEVIEYLKEEGDWNPAWDAELGID